MPRKSLTTDQFIEKSKIIHGDKYDYSLVDYKNNHTKVKIICSIHGIFEQRPNDHLNNYNCSYCSNRLKIPIERLIEKFNKIHNYKYKYFLFKEYKNQQSEIKIICPTHGVFSQKINNHLNNKGCKYCANNIKYSNDEFIKKSKEKHGDKYDYSLVEYKNAKTKIKLICKKHGEFSVSPNNHISKLSGCPICNESKGEHYISKILKKYKIKYKREYELLHEKYSPIYPLKADFYLYEKNIIVEYNGIQHYQKIPFFDNDNGFKKIKNRDKRKKEICKDTGIKLVIITYKLNKLEDIEDKLKKVLKL